MRRTNLIALILLVPALAVFGWVASEDARTGYLIDEPRIAVGPGADGWATIEDTNVRVTTVEELEGVEDFDGSLWTPPHGYALWRVGIEVRSGMADSRECTVRVMDADGRYFTPPSSEAGLPTPAWSTLSCGGPGDEDYEPTRQTIVMLPDDSRPVVLELTSSGIPTALSPEYFSLPLR